MDIQNNAFNLITLQAFFIYCENVLFFSNLKLWDITTPSKYYTVKKIFVFIVQPL